MSTSEVFKVAIYKFSHYYYYYLGKLLLGSLFIAPGLKQLFNAGYVKLLIHTRSYCFLKSSSLVTVHAIHYAITTSQDKLRIYFETLFSISSVLKNGHHT